MYPFGSCLAKAKVKVKVEVKVVNFLKLCKALD